MSDLFAHIVGIVTESSGYLLLGFAMAGVLHVVLARYPRITSLLTGAGPRPVAMATLIGVPLPLCSCSVLPAAISLRRQGAGRGPTAAFLISVPETDVVSILLTFALLGPTLAIFRPIAALITALVAGISVGALDRFRAGTPDNTSPVPAHCCEPGETPAESGALMTSDPTRPWWSRALRYGFIEIFDDIIVQLFIGLVVAGALVAWLPSVDIGRFTGNSLATYLVMLAVGVPVYVCATASTPIAAGLIAGGLSPGAAMVFLLAGPATNIASFFVLRREFGKALLSAYVVAIAVVSVLMGVLLDTLIGNSLPAPVVSTGHDHAAAWIENAAAVAFLLLLVASLWRTKVQPRLRTSSRKAL